MRSAEAEPIGALSLPAEKAELSEQDAESRNVGFVRELVRLLVKTQKAQRLYEPRWRLTPR